MKKLPIQIKRLDPGATDLPLPRYMSEHAAGMDLYAAVTVPVTLEPGQRLLIPTGLAIAVPPGFEAQIRPRSGLALKRGISLVNSPGTIDSDYRGPVGIIMINHGNEPFTINRGERIAQMIIAPVIQAEWHETDELSETDRNTGGFGHTGI